MELAPIPAAHLRRWLFLLRGEASLARRGWDEAVGPLTEALAAARIEEDPGAVARCLASLGRAHYRAGRFAVAEPLLRESLTTAPADAPERTGALRALADIALRVGRLDEAERLWTEALSVSLDTGNKDVEARSRRGLAHLRAIQGDLDAAAELLAEADQLLGPEGDYRVRAGVLARAVELDTAAGRLGSAAYRADILIELARRHGMCERLPEAYALLAELRLRVGDREGARDATQQNVVFTRASAGIGWEPRLRAARALAELGHRAEALAALPAEDEVPSSPVDDPPAQLAAVRAQLIADDDPLRARDLAGWAMTRPAPLLSLAGARIALDSARALHRAGSSGAARNAVKHGLARLGSGGDGLRLELLVVMQEIAPDPRVTDALGALAARTMPLLPPGAQDTFAARPVIRDVVA
jgi:tetratricopeptide (TPR) repeat protein